MKIKLLLLLPVLLVSSCDIVFNPSVSKDDSSINQESSSEIKEDSSDVTSSTSNGENTSTPEDSSSESSSEQEEINYDVTPTNYYTFPHTGVKKTYTAGQTMDLKEYSNFIILDSKGRIYYSVANAGCGYGMDKMYYSHPLYQNEVESSINKTLKSVKIPTNFKGYSISFEEYGKYANKLSNGDISTSYFEDYAYEEYTHLWNSFSNPYLTLANGIKIESAPVDVALPALGSRTKKTYNGTSDGNDYFYSADAKPTSTTIVDGLVHTKYTYSSIDGYSVNVHTVVADLNKVTFELGTPSNSYSPTSKAVLKSQATAYESGSNRKVYAAVNGDFFGAGAVGMPNGFSVKDGVVVSNCSPWYESLVNGMWAFSVSYNNVASIDKSANSASNYYYVDNYIDLYNNKATLVKSNKIDSINNKTVYDPNYGTSRPINNSVLTTSGSSVSNKNVVYVTKTDKYDNGNGNINFPFDGKITKVAKNYSGTVTLSSNEVALVVDSSFASIASINHRVRVGVSKSSNAAFSNVKTLIGGRHLLVKDNKEVSNVSSETTNGGTSRRARTAIGLTNDGKVMLFACNDGTGGLTFKQVADFMAYYGCRIAMNLDGGGSTGMYVRSNNELVLKCGANTRALTNSLLIVEK